VGGDQDGEDDENATASHSGEEMSDEIDEDDDEEVTM